MTATVGFQLRLELELWEALEQLAPRGKKNEYIRGLIRADIERRRDNRELPKKRKKA